MKGSAFPEGPSMTIPFSYVGGHLISVPAQVNKSIQTRFILDTGIGLNVISKALCTKIGCKLTGDTYTGKRMSGQEVSVPLAKVSALSVGPHRQENALVGVLDMSGFSSEFASVEGVVSLQFFEKEPFTVDYRSRTVTVENETSLASRLTRGTEVPIKVDKDGTTVGIFLGLSLPNGKSVTVEVDTGSDVLILNTKFMAQLGVYKDRDDVKKVGGKDETGHSFTRYFGRILGAVSLLVDPSIAQQNPEVMFQHIIYDGLVGDSFLKSYTVTYDIAHSRMIFAKPF